MSLLNKISSKINNYLNLSKENAELKLLVASQAQEIILLKAQIVELTKRLDQLSIKKDSHNSSMSPSSDIVTKNKSLRTKSGKKPGGQKGHKGHTLKMTETPDKVINLVPSYCNKCGKKLVGSANLISRRQVLDIPPILPYYTEYRNHQISCECGHCQSSTYPEEVSNNIQYGENIQSFIAYLSVYQYIPYKRMQDLFRHFFSINISQGTILNILNKMATKASSLYQSIKNNLEEAESIGSDETGARVNGKKNWIWVWQNLRMTFISLETSRGKKVIEQKFPKGFPHGIIGTDRWAAQLQTYAKGHQLCFAHLLRDLTFLIELEKTDFASKLKKLFLKTIKLKRAKIQYDENDPIVAQVETELDILLKKELSTDDYPKTETFRKSMVKNRNSIFTFLYFKNVEPDNNSSERAIRNVKVKQKISGQFKSGGQNFCVLRSVIDTTIKGEKDILNILSLVAANKQVAV